MAMKKVAAVVGGVGGLSIVGLALVFNVSIHSVEPHPRTLLAQDALQRKEADVNRHIESKLYEMNVNTEEESVDLFANTLFSTTLFNVVNVGYNDNLGTRRLPVPASFPKGAQFDGFRVVDRSDTNKELLVHWSNYKIDLAGSFYIRVFPIDAKRKKLQFGTVLVLPPGERPDFRMTSYNVCTQLCLLSSAVAMSFK
jgi:hypothetical protein